MSRFPAVLAGFAALALSATALAQPAPQIGSPTANIQGDQAAWINDPHIHAFYELTVRAFAAGPDKVDQKAFTAKSYALFREFAVSLGDPPEQMVDHLKLIPGQVVQIVKEDPGVLKSYDNFVAAIFGPQ